MAEDADPFIRNKLTITLTSDGGVPMGTVEFFVEDPGTLTGHITKVETVRPELGEAITRAVESNEGRVAVLGGSIPDSVDDDWGAVLETLDYLRAEEFPHMEWEAPDVWHALLQEEEGKVH